MTTDNRRLEDLLEMSSYQGMTDEEINMVIEFKTEQAAKRAAYDATVKAQQENAAQHMNDLKVICANSEQHYNDVMNSRPALEVIEYEQA